MKKPDICGSLQSTSEFRHPWKVSETQETFSDIELDIMESNKIKLNAKNDILAIEQSPHDVSQSDDP